ncbi:MAG: NAD(+) synthase [Ruminococcaceae bacterium]|nr:NAD(+) synthase [Oscillospiraceae bacterium]
MLKDILRAAVAVPPLRVADVAYNAAEIERKIHAAEEAGATVLVLPELALTGASCGDLFASELLQERAAEALCLLAGAVPEGMLVAVGAPLSVGGVLLNCAVLLSGGKILCAVPKTHLTGEEARCFASGREIEGALVTVGCFTFPVGTALLVEAADGTTVGVELGEDLYAPLPPSTLLTMAGAEVVLHLGADGEMVGRREYRRSTVLQQSARTCSAYLMANAGLWESGADGICAGHGLMAIGGKTVAENADFVAEDYLLVADFDLAEQRYDRRYRKSFSGSAAYYGAGDSVERVALTQPLAISDGALLQVSRLPFVPDRKEERTARCLEIFELQAAALARRLSVVGGKLTIGISGGLDSTLAVLVAVRAMERLGLPATNITAITMPCFGTSGDTLKNALELMEVLGVSAREIPIKEAVLQHFRDIGHDPADYSVTYENSQARERTQVLMDVANQVGGIVLGTGDLSELALGWCTYNGDHMSMYGVNSGVPKTLVRWIVETVADEELLPAATPVLLRILDTPISPELLPPDAVGKISQKTEDLVGPYALHDFFLYYAVRYQYRPARIYALALKAFSGVFDGATVKKWLTVFWRRFFNQQFKRNCQPDGVKIGSVALSPRGEWHMPSDAVSAEWLREIEEIEI